MHSACPNKKPNHLQNSLPPTDPILGPENLLKTGFAQKGLPSRSAATSPLIFGSVSRHKLKAWWSVGNASRYEVPIDCPFLGTGQGNWADPRTGAKHESPRMEAAYPCCVTYRGGPHMRSLISIDFPAPEMEPESAHVVVSAVSVP